MRSDPPQAESPPAVLDASGRYAVRGAWSYATIGLYVVLVLLLVYINGRPTSYLVYSQLPLLLAAIVLIYLARYLSTRYLLDSDYLRARRIFGSRRVPLESIHRIQLANLRDLGPVGFFGSWGWRGRMWSPNPSVGRFDTIHTVSLGLLITGAGVPLFISPRDPLSFARELSRRVRSTGVQLDEDVGGPAAAAGATAAG